MLYLYIALGLLFVPLIFRLWPFMSWPTKVFLSLPPGIWVNQAKVESILAEKEIMPATFIDGKKIRDVPFILNRLTRFGMLERKVIGKNPAKKVIGEIIDENGGDITYSFKEHIEASVNGDEKRVQSFEEALRKCKRLRVGTVDEDRFTIYEWRRKEDSWKGRKRKEKQKKTNVDKTAPALTS